MKYRIPDSRIVDFIGTTATVIIFGVFISVSLCLLRHSIPMPIKNLPFGNFTREDSGLEIVEATFALLSPAGGARENPEPLVFSFAAAVRATVVSILEMLFSLISSKFYDVATHHRENYES